MLITATVHSSLGYRPLLLPPPQMSNRVNQQDYSKRVQVRGIIRHSSVQNEVPVQVRRLVREIDAVVHHVNHNIHVELCPEFLLLRLPVTRYLLHDIHIRYRPDDLSRQTFSKRQERGHAERELA